MAVIFHVQLGTALLSPWEHSPLDPLQKKKGNWKFAGCDFPFRINATMLPRFVLNIARAEYSVKHVQSKAFCSLPFISFKMGFAN